MEVGFPLGGFKSVTPSALTGAVNILHTASVTYAKFSGNLTAAVSALTLATGSNTPQDGDKLILEIPSSASAYTVTCSTTNFTKATVITGVASNSVVAMFIAVGGKFNHVSTVTQTLS